MKIGEIEIEIEIQEEQLQSAVEQLLSTIINKFKGTNLISPDRPYTITPSRNMQRCNTQIMG